jgi:hypothetical protein
MIVGTKEPPRYRTRFSDVVHEAFADTTADREGGVRGSDHMVCLKLR